MTKNIYIYTHKDLKTSNIYECILLYTFVSAFRFQTTYMEAALGVFSLSLDLFWLLLEISLLVFDNVLSFLFVTSDDGVKVFDVESCDGTKLFDMKSDEAKLLDVALASSMVRTVSTSCFNRSSTAEVEEFVGTYNSLDFASSKKPEIENTLLHYPLTRNYEILRYT